LKDIALFTPEIYHLRIGYKVVEPASWDFRFIRIRVNILARLNLLTSPENQLLLPYARDIHRKAPDIRVGVYFRMEDQR